MKRLVKVLAVLALVIICVAVFRSNYKINAAGPAGAGVNIDPTFSPARPTAAKLQAAGVKWVRFVYKSDTFNYLSVMKEYEAAGIKVVLVLNQETLWPPSGDGNFDQQYVHDFGEKAKKLAAFFGNNVDAYEIWNEEDASSPASIYVNPAHYAALLSATYNAIKNANSNAVVLVGGLVSGDPTYLDKTAANILGGRFPADGVAVHPYIIDVNALANSVRSYLSHAQGRPLWVTEFGWEVSGQTQADYLCAVYTKLQLDSQLNSNVAVVDWYTWTDASNPGFGLVNSSNQPKESFYAFQKCASQYNSPLTQDQLLQLFQESITNIQPIIDSTPNAGNPGVSHPPDYNPTQDNDTVAKTFRPLGSLEACPAEIPLNGKIAAKGLPSCVPTSDKNNPNRCVSECSPPINIEENLQLFGDCLKDSNCRARITIDQNKFYLPFAQKLGDYFTGVLDSEHLPAAKLDALQQGLRRAVGVQEVLDDAGVIRKLTPEPIQSRLKCQFRDYVRDKLKNGGNTKYLDRSDPNHIIQFQVLDKNVSEIECPPSVDPNSKYKSDSDWSADWSRYWFAMPLFPNDESLGKIEFVSPSIFNNYANSPTLKDAFGNPVKVGPIYVSIPEIQRVDLATRFIQKAIIPSGQVLTADNPQTIGNQFTPTIALNACAAGWSAIYDSRSATDTLGKNYQLSQYNRAVNCSVPNLSGQNDSTVCTVDPNGQLRCGSSSKNAPGAPGCSGGNCNYTETVQVRTVFPHLYDIAEQTISPLRGLLRIFKPAAIQNLAQSSQDVSQATDIFEKKFEPIPASINGVHYKLESDNNSLYLADKPDGWQIFFYKLGGLVNARNFVLQLLNPPAQQQP